MTDEGEARALIEEALAECFFDPPAPSVGAESWRTRAERWLARDDPHAERLRAWSESWDPGQ